jgi:hypothetical protein
VNTASSSMGCGAGYHTTNVAEHYVHGELPAYGSVTTTMVNLADATDADHETIAALIKTIAALSEKLVAKEFFVKTKDADIKCLTQGCAPVGTPVTAAHYYTHLHPEVVQDQ